MPAISTEAVLVARRRTDPIGLDVTAEEIRPRIFTA
jgi:hypothetical protein